jgi:hypothetical protein
VPPEIASLFKKKQTVFDLVLLVPKHEIAFEDKKGNGVIKRRLLRLFAFEPDARH